MSAALLGIPSKKSPPGAAPIQIHSSQPRHHHNQVKGLPKVCWQDNGDTVHRVVSQVDKVEGPSGYQK
jgi:hypothetical protein